MGNPLSNDELRKISPFLVVDTKVYLLANGKLEKTVLTMSLDESAAYKLNATDWEKQNTAWGGGSSYWTPIIDDAGTIIAYTMTEEASVVIFLIRDVNGEILMRQVIGEKPLESDVLGDMLASTVLTLGGGLVVRSIAAAFARIAGSAALAAGARAVSIAIARVAAGETTEGAVLTALRSVRAQSIVKSLQQRGVRIIVNIGGEAGPEEVAGFGADQIALNAGVRMTKSVRYVPNLIKEPGDKIGEVFSKNSIDLIVSRKLPVTFDPNKIAKGAYSVLKPGGKLSMHIYTDHPKFAAEFTTALSRAGFKNVSSVSNSLFEAVK